jgi:DnaJ-class molecular chaperone
MVKKEEDEIYELCDNCKGHGYFITKRVRIRKPKILQTIACDQCKGSGRRGLQ